MAERQQQNVINYEKYKIFSSRIDDDRAFILR